MQGQQSDEQTRGPYWYRYFVVMSAMIKLQKCAKMAESINMLFGLWTYVVIASAVNVGPCFAGLSESSHSVCRPTVVK